MFQKWKPQTSLFQPSSYGGKKDHPKDKLESKANSKRRMFGVVFPDRSFPMDMSSFSQIDPLHWPLPEPQIPLSLVSSAGAAYHDVREICIFLLNAASLPPEKALAVYVQAPGHPFLFCGSVHIARPSAVLSLPWPDLAEVPDAAAGAIQVAGAGAAAAKIGISVEDLSALPPVMDAGAEKRVERLALRVGENLFNFMQSFCGVDGSRLVVPMDILDRWFKKLKEKAQRDPNYFKGFAF
ncbi:ribulose-phosphate 3-epimerase [Apostasia shenzhenica]|uniref:Ribulose-phosphate 3-epimerase n=1 Tax=Apostasia shenzhenica TaxID=1088818 RepID=A0A2I0B4S1_9ASPA|nr:ribulose-phosphate 3-epimerase [Apostasia shenzhenica]